MHCASCEQEVCEPTEAFTGDVCPRCDHFAHPTRLGFYEGLELIKRGGMGSVYRARHTKLGTNVAIKVVHTNTGPATLIERFEREAGLAARIPHPGIVRVFDYDCQEGRLYLVMELIEGATLRQHIQEGTHDVGWCLDKVAQLADILQAAHDQGIVHRDIKPENVMVDPTGRVRVLDFGISCVLEGEERLTRTGEILGTPEYISPEQILDAPSAIDARTDIYATGVVLYEMLTGRSPFAGNNLFQVLKYVESLTPARPSELKPGISTQLDELVMECMAKDKAGRPASAGNVARRLRSLASPEAVVVRTRPWPSIAIGLLGLVLGLVAGSLFWNRGAERSAKPVVSAPSPAESMELILAGNPRPDLDSLWDLARAIPDSGSASELYWRGFARQRCGALFAAAQDFEDARLEDPRAELQARVLWIYKHRLLPVLFGGPRWLMAATDPTWKSNSAEAPVFERGLAALYRNEFGAAARWLEVSKRTGHDQRVLLGLAHYLNGDLRKAAEAVRQGAQDYLPLLLLTAVLDDEKAVEGLRSIGADMDRFMPMRYLIEVAVAIRSGDLPRLRAATELVLVAGEAHYATSVYLAARVWMGGTDRGSAEALLAMANGLTAAETPGLACTKALLAQLSGTDPASFLNSLSRDLDPMIAFFQAWRDAPASARGFYVGVHNMGRYQQALNGWAEAAEQTGSSDESGLARRFLAVALLGDQASTLARQGLFESVSKAIAGGSALMTFRHELMSFSYRFDVEQTVTRILVECLGKNQPPSQLLPLLQSAILLGLDPQVLLGNATFTPLHKDVLGLLPGGGKDGR